MVSHLIFTNQQLLKTQKNDEIEIKTNKKEENWYYQSKDYLSDLKNMNDVEKYFIDNILKDVIVRNINI